jgi:hypothetical protein
LIDIPENITTVDVTRTSALRRSSVRPLDRGCGYVIVSHGDVGRPEKRHGSWIMDHGRTEKRFDNEPR